MNKAVTGRTMRKKFRKHYEEEYAWTRQRKLVEGSEVSDIKELWDSGEQEGLGLLR